VRAVFATRVDGDLVTLHWEAPGAPLLAFSTRRGGVSPPPFDTLNLGLSTHDDPRSVRANRERLLRALGADPACLATAGQVHGAAVRLAERPGHLAACDALLTTQPGLALAVSTADCAPVLLWAPGAVAAVHAGWRGAARGVASAAVRALAARAACTPRDVTALIGPCIHPCCYPVGSEVAACFPPECLVGRDGATRLDLPRTLTLELQRAGVGACHDVKRCTSCQSEWFFSHRRDGDRTGRQWGLAFLPAAHHT
jgi:YfiH family protein